ncbi:hypothetical protein GW17_00015549 [Ensete ventricosum]|nr:hypothetical protein GW17_00015549 [Ensete ventricosum]
MSIVMLRHFVSVLLSSRWSNAVYPATYADPYLNTDAGTMSPFEHGEVFVLDDGGEVKIAVDVIVWSPEALLHASVACRRKLVVDWVPSSDLEETAAEEVRNGILVPGGFGDRGVQGKILAAKYARENKIPYLGICLGMQIAVIEFARSVMNLREANSTEFDPDTTAPVVIFMPEIIELPSHPYYVGVQFHPEFKSRPGKPSAVFLAPNIAPFTFVLSVSSSLIIIYILACYKMLFDRTDSRILPAAGCMATSFWRAVEPAGAAARSQQWLLENLPKREPEEARRQQPG